MDDRARPQSRLQPQHPPGTRWLVPVGEPPPPYCTNRLAASQDRAVAARPLARERQGGTMVNMMKRHETARISGVLHGRRSPRRRR